ncbi:hypothetical protein Prudu_010367 [Prunus dulcis]|uniref:Uncharacterized protein n=1 Tax=Prunus dulcis TaxID=3755 RepID=A0A4Y1R853_PRUDU|nr:hypothetical protein Prudu_010367 [Prunus dulcis]
MSIFWWTVDSATKFGFPGFANFPMAVGKVVAENRVLERPESDTELITTVALMLLEPTEKATVRSFGMIVNSFYELEPVFTDYWNTV